MKKHGGMLAVLFLVIVSGSGARAQVLFSLTPNSVIANPGDHLALTGKITNTSGVDVSLLGSSGVITGPSNVSLSIDDNDFLDNLPVTLANGSFYQNNIFVDAVANPTFGSYTVSYSVDGESGVPAVPFSKSSNVGVTIRPAVSSVPEPATLHGLAAGLIAAMMIFRRRRK